MMIWSLFLSSLLKRIHDEIRLKNLMHYLSGSRLDCCCFSRSPMHELRVTTSFQQPTLMNSPVTVSLLVWPIMLPRIALDCSLPDVLYKSTNSMKFTKVPRRSPAGNTKMSRSKGKNVHFDVIWTLVSPVPPPVQRSSAPWKEPSMVDWTFLIGKRSIQWLLPNSLSLSLLKCKNWWNISSSEQTMSSSTLLDLSPLSDFAFLHVKISIRTDTV